MRGHVLLDFTCFFWPERVRRFRGFGVIELIGLIHHWLARRTGVRKNPSCSCSLPRCKTRNHHGTNSHRIRSSM